MGRKLGAKEGTNLVGFPASANQIAPQTSQACDSQILKKTMLRMVRNTQAQIAKIISSREKYDKHQVVTISEPQHVIFQALRFILWSCICPVGEKTNGLILEWKTTSFDPPIPSNIRNKFGTRIRRIRLWLGFWNSDFFNQVANPTKSVATHLAKPIQEHIILADTYADFATKTIPKLIDLSKLLSFLVSENLLNY